MKTDNNIVHTRGEIEIREWADESIDLKIKGDVTHYIAQINKQDKYGEAKANAEHIARCWNNHYALLDALKGLLSSYRADFKTITEAELNNTESVLKASAAIKAAEQQ